MFCGIKREQGEGRTEEKVILEHELAKEKGTGRGRWLQRITPRHAGERGKERYQKQEKGTSNKEDQRRNEPREEL